MLCCNIFIFLGKQKVPSYKDLQWLSQQLEKWKCLGRCLKIKDAKLTAIDNEEKNYTEKIYQMLEHWKRKNGSAATNVVLRKALCNPSVSRRDLVEKFCCQPHE